MLSGLIYFQIQSVLCYKHMPIQVKLFEITINCSAILTSLNLSQAS